MSRGHSPDADDALCDEPYTEDWTPDLTPIPCVRGGTTTRDSCQSCWVDGEVMRSGPGVGCKEGRLRRDRSAREVTGFRRIVTLLTGRIVRVHP